MDLNITHKPLDQIETEFLVVTVFEDNKDCKHFKYLDEKLDGKLTKLVENGEIKGKYKEFTVLHTHGDIAPKRLLFLGMGKEKDLNYDKVRSVAAISARNTRRINCHDFAIHNFSSYGLDPLESACAITEGIQLGLYRFHKYKTDKKDDTKAIHKLTISVSDESTIPASKEGAEKGIILAEAGNFTRNLVNEPACYMTPAIFAETAKELAKENNFKIKVLEAEDLEKEGMGAHLAVGRGSVESPKLVVMEYNGKEGAPTIGIVGKGVTFDSGGYNIKPTSGITRMYGDMGGAAATLGAIKAISKLKLPVNVVALTPLAENLVSNNAYKPSDILKSMSGKTIEVLNTDAEGRLLLCDSLTYIQKYYKLDALADIATLTGAIVVALGRFISGVMSPNQELVDRMSAAGEIAGERVWALPLYDEYRAQLISDVADIENVGGRSGGSITAGMFLKEFVNEDQPWIHIDIAGTSMMEEEIMRYVKTPFIPKEGATGTGARLLYHFVESFAE